MPWFAALAWPLTAGEKVSGLLVSRAKLKPCDAPTAPASTCARLQFIEAHATSTQAGNVTEMTALAEALRDQLPQGTKIPIGSVKANIGHTLETAGMASLLKVVLAMQHEVIPRQINVENLNKGVDWDSAPFLFRGTISPGRLP